MPKEVTGGTTQLTVRLNNDWLPRLDVAAAQLSRPGLELTRADVIRVAVARGLEAIERDLSGQEATMQPTTTPSPFKKLSRDELDLLRAVDKAPSPHNSYTVAFALGAHGRIRAMNLEHMLQLLWSAGFITKRGSVWELTAAGRSAIGKPT